MLGCRMAGLLAVDDLVRTGLPGLFHTSLAHVCPDDREVSKAIGVGRQAARQAHAELA